MNPTEDSYRQFWNYLSQPQKDLILEGQYLMNDVVRHGNYHFKDYSFLIFPFAKAYEGFLKQIFRDVKFISHLDYISDHLRLGKLLSPNLIERLGDRSLYLKLQQSTTTAMAEEIWHVWKIGRNEIFHYFPHNLKAVTFPQAETLVNEIVDSMEKVFQAMKSKINPDKLRN